MAALRPQPQSAPPSIRHHRTTLALWILGLVLTAYGLIALAIGVFASSSSGGGGGTVVGAAVFLFAGSFVVWAAWNRKPPQVAPAMPADPFVSAPTSTPAVTRRRRPSPLKAAFVLTVLWAGCAALGIAALNADANQRRSSETQAHGVAARGTVVSASSSKTYQQIGVRYSFTASSISLSQSGA